MKVLIIGAKGMLGRAMVEAFAGHEVTPWDREEVDIADKENFKFQITNHKPDLVINCAAYTNVDKAETESEIANQVNGYAVGELAKITKELDIPLVHYSTDYVFDGENESGYDEQAQSNPISAYGRSKLFGEQELRKNTDKFYLIRLSRLFGESGAGKKSFPQTMLELAEKQNEIEVVDEEVSCPTYAPDLAKLTRYIVENKLPYGIYHGANNGSCTWYGFAQEIFKITRKDVRIKAVAGSKFQRAAMRPKYAMLINTKLPHQRPWQDALKEFLTS